MERAKKGLEQIDVEIMTRWQTHPTSSLGAGRCCPVSTGMGDDRQVGPKVPSASLGTFRAYSNARQARLVAYWAFGERSDRL